MNEADKENQLSKPVANAQLEIWDGPQLPALHQHDNWRGFYYQWVPADQQTFPASVNPRQTSTFNQQTPVGKHTKHTHGTTLVRTCYFLKTYYTQYHMRTLFCHAKCTYTTTTTTILHLSGLWPGQPGWAGTRRSIHPLTPIVVINHPLSASSIFCDTSHPPCSIYVPDSLFPQSLSKFFWSTSWPGTFHFTLHTFNHPIIVFFSHHMPIPSQPVLL